MIRALPYLVAGALFVLGLWAMYRLLAPVDLAQVAAQIRATPWPVMGLALMATLCGYLCLAGYDWSALRYIGKPLPLPVVMTGGLMAYAFGNTIGLTAISGGAVRWRVYSGLGLTGLDIAAISTFTAVSYGMAATVIGLGALAAHPTALAAMLPFSAGVVRIAAVAAIVAIMGPLVWASRSGRALRWRRFALRAPSLPVLGAQVAISLGDVVSAALVLYLFLPVTDCGFFTFLAVFAAAMMAGVISHVPGGIGVFEVVIMAAMPTGTPVGQVAAALLLFRMVYYLVPFGAALLLLSAYEGWRMLGRPMLPSRLGHLVGVIEPALRAVTALTPVVLAVMIFGSGLWMTLSAILRLSPATDDAAEALFPLAFVDGSALMSSALGTGLIVLSLGVLARSRGAFWLAVAAMAAGVGVALTGQPEWERAAALTVAIGVLLPFRHGFDRDAVLTHAPFTPGWVALLLAAVSGFGCVLFFAGESMAFSGKLWWQFALDDTAPRWLRAGLTAGLLVGVGALIMLLRAPDRR